MDSHYEYCVKMEDKLQYEGETPKRDQELEMCLEEIEKNLTKLRYAYLVKGNGHTARFYLFIFNYTDINKELYFCYVWNFREQELELENSLPWLQQQSHNDIASQDLLPDPSKLDMYNVILTIFI